MKSTLNRIAMTSVLALIIGTSTVHASAEEDMMMVKKYMQTAQAFVQSAVGGSGNVFVSVKGDTATIIGFVENTSIKMMAENAALMDMRVSKVKSHILISTNR